MNVLPVVGFLTGAALADRRAFLVTLATSAVGLILVAVFTDEIEGPGDAYMWVIVIVSLLTTSIGIALGRWIRSRRRARPAA